MFEFFRNANGGFGFTASIFRNFAIRPIIIRKVLFEEITEIGGKKYIIGYNERYIRIAVNADEIKDAQSKCNTITDVEIIGKADDDDMILGKINDNI